MVKNLVIVESPAKAKTIEGFLGKEFMVKSSFGHIRDLKKGNKGVLVEEQFEPVYEVSVDKKTVVAELKKLADQAEVVWLASDFRDCPPFSPICPPPGKLIKFKSHMLAYYRLLFRFYVPSKKKKRELQHHLSFQASCLTHLPRTYENPFVFKT